MKTHTNNYKQNIKKFGREIDFKIQFQEGGQTVELGATTLNSIVPHFEGDILKSSMRQLDLDSNTNIAKNTEIKAKFGLKVNGSYEYIDYGNYIVYSVEKKEDTRSYEIVCYDKMLYAMKDYESLEVTYPISVRDFITALCTKIGLEFKNKYDTFVNYDRQIIQETFLDSDGKSLGYTYRDVLDQLAEVTASTICINEQTDELEIRYPKNTGDYTTVEGSLLILPNVEDERDIELQLKGNTTQNGTPTPSAPVPINVVTGGQEILCVGKNLLRNNLNIIKANNTAGTWNGNTYTLNNVSFTYNEDGSITANGTASANACFFINRTGSNYYTTHLNAGTYYITSHETTGSNTTWKMQINLDGTATNIYGTTSAEATRTTATDMNITNVQLAVYSGYNPNGATFYPMIAKQSGINYEEYKDISNEINLGKNLIYNKNGTASGEYGGVQYTFNEDGTIHAEGTATTNYNLYLMSGSNQLVLSPGTYTLSSGGGTNNYWLRLFDGTNYQDTTNNGIKTFTITQTTSYDCVIRVRSGYTIDFTFKPMLEKSSTATPYSPYKTPYSPYKTPIELCKISTYQDSIKKATGKNLFDKDNANILDALIDGSTHKITSSSGRKTIYMEIQPNTTYTVSKMLSSRFIVATFTDLEAEYTNKVEGASDTSKTITSGANDKYLAVFFYHSSYDTTITPEQILETMQVEIGETATPYEPYGTGWYIEKQIGKVVLDGSENWTNMGWGNKFAGRTTVANAKLFGQNDNANLKSNYFVSSSVNTLFQQTDTYGIAMRTDSSEVVIRYDDATNTINLKTWLSTHNTTVYYILANPTYTFIEDEELINQLESVRLLYGLNNIMVGSGDLSSPINLKYIASIDTLDETFLKDVNVNFGEKYGKINSVVLSRSAESDNIYLQDEESIEENGLCEIKIADNQIMNFNDRANFLPEIFNKLNGFYYYINDFSSTGITYLEICDMYNIAVGGNKYKCIMFNDEVNIESGLEENIHTDMPGESVTDYKKADKTDRKINTAYIIANKMEAEIDEVTNQLNETTGNLNTVITKQTATDRAISILSININDETGDVNSVTTKEKRFTFNDEGLTITNSETNFKSLQDETGTYYYDGNSVIGQYTKDGSKQKDLSLFGVYYYGMDEINDTPMFVAELFTDDNDEEAVGHFYNGGDY